MLNDVAAKVSDARTVFRRIGNEPSREPSRSESVRSPPRVSTAPSCTWQGGSPPSLEASRCESPELSRSPPASAHRSTASSSTWQGGLPPSPARRSTPMGIAVDRPWRSPSSLAASDSAWQGGSMTSPEAERYSGWEQEYPNWPTTSAAGYLEWGVDHPDARVSANSNARAQWSASELRYIERWCTKNNSASMKDLLECIRADLKARKIFHERHVLNSARLRAGYLAYLTKAGLDEH